MSDTNTTTHTNGSVNGVTTGRTYAESPYSPLSDLIVGHPDDIIQTCPKYDSCNVPICPLDREWTTRCHLQGEAMCRYLREWAKVASGMATRTAFESDLSVQAQNMVAEAYPEILNAHGAIKSAMVKAALTPSKMTKGKIVDWKPRGVTE